MFLSKPKKKKILIHSCCGVCALGVIEILKKDFQEIILFYYNPNIHPEQEYLKRLEIIKRVASIYRVPLIEGPYNPSDWFRSVRGREKEPEGGARCTICIRGRLETTAKLAQERKIPLFTTTLTISPYKNSLLINNLGASLAKKYQLKFLEADFKKKDGFKKTIELAKKYNIYRQNYCGCLFSMTHRRV